MALSESESQQLATLYEAAVWKTFRKHFLENRQLEIAALSTFAPNWEQVLQNRGMVTELRNIEVEMSKNYKKRLNRERKPDGKSNS